MSARLYRAVASRLMMAGTLLTVAAPAPAQVPATMTIDNVRASGNGRHRVVVSVLDASGAPVPGLDGAFVVTLGERAVEQLVARPARDERSRATVTLVLDAGLLRPPALGAVTDAVRARGRSLAESDRIRVIAAGSSLRSREAAASDAERLAGQLAGMESDGTPMLYDALFNAARDAARLPDNRNAAVIVITRGADGGSGHTLIEVLASARTPKRLTRVMVLQLGDGGAAPEAERLRRLAEHTGGGVTRVSSAPGLPGALPGTAARALGDWVLTFDAPQWARGAERQTIEVVVDAHGARRTAKLDYATSESLLPAWWTNPLLWLLPVAVLGIAAAAWALTRRRQRGLLVHDRDEDDGVWYELFALPVTLGGAAGNDIVFQGAQISRNHATLERRGRVVELVDLNSENGTFVNGERITRRALADGDRLSLGKSVHLIYEARG
jgi:hypothetical protein